MPGVSCRHETVHHARCSPSYLNETLTFARYALTTPFSITRSSCATSATRRSHSVSEALVTAAAAAFSQLSVLVPTNSMILYTLSAMGTRSLCALVVVDDLVTCAVVGGNVLSAA